MWPNKLVFEISFLSMSTLNIPVLFCSAFINIIWNITVQFNSDAKCKVDLFNREISATYLMLCLNIDGCFYKEHSF